MIIEIYNNSGDTLLAEFSKIISANVSEKLNNSISWNFEIPENEASISETNLQEYNIVKISNISWEIFQGYIVWLEVKPWTVKVLINDQNSIWNKKLVYTEKNYTSWTWINTILSEILTEINSRYDTGYVLDTDVTDTISWDLNFSKWEKFINVLKTLSDLWYEYITRNWKLEFKTAIWENKTNPSNSNYFKYEYNTKSPLNNNVDNIRAILNWKNISNALIWKSWIDYSEQEDATSISNFWRLEESVFSDGDISTFTAEKLSQSKSSVKELTITPQVKSYNEHWIWDLLDCEIIWENNLIDYSGTVKVLEKKYSISEWENIEYKISPVKTITRTFIKQFSDLQNEVHKILLK